MSSRHVSFDQKQQSHEGEEIPNATGEYAWYEDKTKFGNSPKEKCQIFWIYQVTAFILFGGFLAAAIVAKIRVDEKPCNCLDNPKSDDVDGCCFDGRGYGCPVPQCYCGPRSGSQARDYSKFRCSDSTGNGQSAFIGFCVCSAVSLAFFLWKLYGYCRYGRHPDGGGANGSDRDGNAIELVSGGEYKHHDVSKNNNSNSNSNSKNQKYLCNYDGTQRDRFRRRIELFYKTHNISMDAESLDRAMTKNFLLKVAEEGILLRMCVKYSTASRRIDPADEVMCATVNGVHPDSVAAQLAAATTTPLVQVPSL